MLRRSIKSLDAQSAIKLRQTSFSLSSPLSTFLAISLQAPAPNVEAYWLTIILKRFTRVRKAASRAVKCEQTARVVPADVRHPNPRKIYGNLGQKSASSSLFAPNQRFKCQMVLSGPGLCVSGFSACHHENPNRHPQRMLTKLTTPIAFVYASRPNIASFFGL